MNFTPYTPEDKAALLFNELYAPNESLSPDQWPATQGSLEDIRAKIASGEEVNTLAIDTERENEVWQRLVAQIKEDIETMKVE